MATDLDFTPATDAEIRADLPYHRRTYLGFLSLLKWVAVVSAVALVVVFFLLNSVDVTRMPGP